MVAVGCILAGEGEGGATTGTGTLAAVSAAMVVTAPTILVVLVLVVVWLRTAADARGATAAVAVPVGAVAIPALRMFWPGAMDRAMPVCGPETGILLTVAVGCTILAMFTMGGVAQASSAKRRGVGLAFGGAEGYELHAIIGFSEGETWPWHSPFDR